MNKYLRGAINLLVGLVVIFTGVVVFWNIIVAGFLFFPDLTMKVDTIAMKNIEGPALLVPGLIPDLLPGALPVIFLLATMGFAVFVMAIAIKWGKKFDIEKIINVFLKRRRPR